jgi:hypothetical protein
LLAIQPDSVCGVKGLLAAKNEFDRMDLPCRFENLLEEIVGHAHEIERGVLGSQADVKASLIAVILT